MKQPTIIFSQSDQQRWDTLGCENPLIKTPFLDQLIADGGALSPSRLPKPHVHPESL